MTTKAGFRTIIRNQGIDDTNWTDTEVNQWLSDAIAEYGQHFPRKQESTANACVADQEEYSLPSDFLAMISVEYPEDEDPRVYLDRLERTDPRFGPGYYDISPDNDTLILGETPSADETYALHYQAAHDYPDADDTVLTVPDEDLELLVLYVKWKAIVRLELDEAKNPDSSTVVLSMLGTNAGRAHFQYMRMLRYRMTTQAAGAQAAWGDS